MDIFNSLILLSTEILNIYKLCKKIYKFSKIPLIFANCFAQFLRAFGKNKVGPIPRTATWIAAAREYGGYALPAFMANDHIELAL